MPVHTKKKKKKINADSLSSTHFINKNRTYICSKHQQLVYACAYTKKINADSLSQTHFFQQKK
jgi:nitrate reductase cytochrome c-type subunit